MGEQKARTAHDARIAAERKASIQQHADEITLVASLIYAAEGSPESAVAAAVKLMAVAERAATTIVDEKYSSSSSPESPR